MQLLFVNNFKFSYFNCHLLDWKTCNDNDDGNDDNRKQEKYNQWYDTIHAKDTGDNGRLTDCIKTSNYVR